VSFPDKLYALCYEPNPYNALALDRMLESLEVPHDIAGTTERMRKLLERCEYTHVFYDKNSEDTVEEFALSQGFQRIPIYEISETRDEKARFFLRRPVLTSDLAAILNGGRTGEEAVPVPGEYSGAAFMQTRNASVLVVDDNSVNLIVARGLLYKFGLAVETAESGPEAIAKVKQKDYDIVFMDHMMPGMDGIDATKHIRELGGRFSTLAIIALTANAVSGMEELFLTSGMNGFIPKPIMINQLRDVLCRHLPAEKIVE
jgi:CheY-like chemotaxis protein